MNILITGVHGFVGSNLVAALKAQHTIYGLDIVSPRKEGVVSTFGWNELEKVPPVEAVIHLAGKAHDTRNQTNAQVIINKVIRLLFHLLVFLLRFDGEK